VLPSPLFTGPRIPTLATVAAAVSIVVGCGGPMQSGELKESVETLTSSAREGALLADEAASDRTKATFTRVSARQLGEVVDHEAEKLSDAEADDAIGADKDRAVSLCEEVSKQLVELQVSPEDRPGAEDIHDELTRLAARAEDLANSL
jgi:hypothetical protein